MTVYELIQKYENFPKCKVIGGHLNILGEWKQYRLHQCFHPDEFDKFPSKILNAEVYRFGFTGGELIIFVNG